MLVLYILHHETQGTNCPGKMRGKQDFKDSRMSERKKHGGICEVSAANFLLVLPAFISMPNLQNHYNALANINQLQ